MAYNVHWVIVYSNLYEITSCKWLLLSLQIHSICSPTGPINLNFRFSLSTSNLWTQTMYTLYQRTG